MLLPCLVLVAFGAFQVVEWRGFLGHSATATAVITKMADVGTQEGYDLCYATVELPMHPTPARARLRLGGYWPENGGSCAEVGDKLEVRYSLRDPSDIRPLHDGSNALALLVIGAFFSIPSLFSLHEWWLSRLARMRTGPPI